MAELIKLNGQDKVDEDEGREEGVWGNERESEIWVS